MPSIVFNRVRHFADRVLTCPQYVEIDRKRIKQLALLLRDTEIKLPTWDDPATFLQSDDPETVCRYLLVLMSVNFSFTDIARQDADVWFSDGKREKFDLLAYRLAQHWDRLQSTEFLAAVDSSYVKNTLFRAETPIPMIEERAAALREVGRFLEDFDSDLSFYNFLKLRHNDPFTAACEISYRMLGWSDPFVKRAQLAMAMMHMRLGERSPINPAHLNDFTVFAESRLPQTGYAMGALQFASPLRSIVSQRQLIASGSLMELELRAGAIVFGDLLLQALWDAGRHELTPLHVDNILWDAQRRRPEFPAELFPNEFLPRYRVRSVVC